MLPVAVKTERGDRYIRPTVEELGELVRRLGGEGDRILVVERVPDLPDEFIQVRHEAGGDYVLEYRDGGPERQFETKLGAADPVVTAVLAWARTEQGWSGTLEWRPVDLGSPDTPAEPELSERQRADLEEWIRLSIVGGYATRGELAELAAYYLESVDGRSPVSQAQAVVLVDRLWVGRVREQEQWEGETDPERLTRAFAALDEAGIVAREDFACCHSCGQAEIGAEASDEARGFVYFHMQGIDHAAAGHGLPLHFGGFDDSEQTTAAVGREVVAALERVGLPVQWDGDPERAITVTPLDWRKRLVG